MVDNRRVDIGKILADPDLRRKLMVSTIQATQAREGIETTKEQADRAYYVVAEGERAAFFDLGKYRGGKGEPDRRHEMFVRAVTSKDEDLRVHVVIADFREISGCPIIPKPVKILSALFRENSNIDPAFAKAYLGLSTKNDNRFVRYHWEVSQNNIGDTKESLFIGKKWARFSNGGDFSRFYYTSPLVLDAEDDFKRIADEVVEKYFYLKGNPEWVLHRNHPHFQEGLTWPFRSQRGFSLRLMERGYVFGNVGPAMFPNNPDDMFFLLGICNSLLSQYIYRHLASFAAWEVGVIKSLPVPQPSHRKRLDITRLAESIYLSKKNWDTGNEISTRFDKPWLLREDIIGPSAPITQRLERLAEFEASEDIRIQTLFDELNDEVYRLYGIPESTRKVIEETLGDRPPEIIWPQMGGKTTGQKRMEHVWRLLSYMVKRVVEADEDGVVPFDTFFKETGLMDRVYREIEDLFSGQPVSRVEVDIVNELKKKVKGYRAVNSIREWLEDIFFSYHASLYKKRPVIWHIASSQGKGEAAFGALVHYHRFDRNGMALLRGTYLREAMEFFRREAALASRENREADRLEWQAKLEEAQDLDRGLQLVQEGHHEGPEFGDRDFRILTPWKSADERPKGWDPDMDDGVKVNIDPLQKARILRIPKVI